MLDWRKIKRDTLSLIPRLKAPVGQAHFVASNAVTIAQAADEQPGAVIDDGIVVSREV